MQNVSAWPEYFLPQPSSSTITKSSEFSSLLQASPHYHHHRIFPLLFSSSGKACISKSRKNSRLTASEAVQASFLVGITGFPGRQGAFPSFL